MLVVESFRIAINALAVRKLRSALTMLGVSIGVAAVIALMSIGRGLEAYVVQQFNDLGSNLLFISAGHYGENLAYRTAHYQPLTIEDAKAVGDPLVVPGVIATAAEYVAPVTIARGRNRMEIRIRAVTPEYDEVRNWHPTQGEFFSQHDYDAVSRVALLGAATYEALFAPGEYPIGQQVLINNVPFEVIGVMEEKGAAPQGNRDEQVFVPLSTAQERVLHEKTASGDYEATMIFVSFADGEQMPAAQNEIASILRERRRVNFLDEDDFTVLSQSDLIAVFGDILKAITIFLGVVAGISLLVGGINIMNIMLVSVTERTREIGLRKAVGASRGGVLSQFLIEAVTLALIGGMLGVTVGVTGAFVVTEVSEAFTAVVRPDAIVTALLFSIAVGLFFGLYPAYRASNMNPIDALRAE